MFSELNKKWYTTVLSTITVESTEGLEDLAKKIEEASEEMLKKHTFKLVTFSMVGTDKAILVFKR